LAYNTGFFLSKQIWGYIVQALILVNTNQEIYYNRYFILA